MIEMLQRVTAWLMSRVRVNHIQRSDRDGEPVFVKRRRFGGGLAIGCGNRFLALANSGVAMFVRADEWVDWEVYCERLLYPDRPGAIMGPGPSVIKPEVRGISLRELVHRHQTNNIKPFVAAARELRRVHQIQCGDYQSAWSHGDLHLDNILYDPDADHAALIDFDTRHDRRVAPTRRHSDDLHLVLLELIGLPGETWREPAVAFLEEYGESTVLDRLRERLIVPNGFARILWYTRTNCRSIRELEPRLQELRRIVGRIVTATSPGYRPLKPDAQAKEREEIPSLARQTAAPTRRTIS